MDEPTKISRETWEMAHAVELTAIELSWNVGYALTNSITGNMVYWFLTDSPPGEPLSNLYVLSATPHGFFGEWNEGPETYLSVITNLADCLEHLMLSGWRGLEKGEIDTIRQ